MSTVKNFEELRAGMSAESTSAAIRLFRCFVLSRFRSPRKLATLLADERLVCRRIDGIDEAAVEDYVQRRGNVESRRGAPLSAGLINRELATLRRLLCLANEWKEIQPIPRIRLLRGEHARESIMTPTQEKVYFAACSSPLGDVALLLLDTGLRLGEELSLEMGST